jgi:predicted permease
MSLAADLRQTWRNACQAPGLTLAVLLTIAVGVGANGAVWSVLRAVLLAPLPYPQPERLVHVNSKFPTLGFEHFWVSPPEFLEYREWNQSFTELGAYRQTEVSVAGADRPLRARAAIASASLFETLGVRPLHGRAFAEGEDVAGAAPVAVISHGLWTEAFGASPAVVGGPIRVDGTDRTLVGVMPPGFDVDESGIDVWLPLGLGPDDRQRRGSHYLFLIARLEPEATVESARAELDRLLGDWESRTGASHTPNRENHPLALRPLHDEVVGDTRPALQALAGAVALLLLIACTNVANLLLSRSDAREREMAIRAAMGAPRRRLLRQMLTESVTLAVAGGLLGVFAAHGGLRALLRASPGSLPRTGDVELDGVVVGASLLVAIVAGVLFGLAPALKLAGGRFEILLKEGARRSTIGGAGARARRLLIVAEMALAVALVVGSALMIRTVRTLLAVDTGFEASHVTAFQLFLPAAGYPEPTDQMGFYGRLVEGLRAIPGVESVGSATGLPPVRDLDANDTQFEGLAPDPQGPPHNIDFYQIVTDGYLETMGIAVLSGRGFSAADGGGAAPVALVNRRTAETFWPGLDPIGRRLRPDGDGAPWLTIVGVVDDVKQGGIDQETGTEVYFRYEQIAAAFGPFLPRTLYTVVRSTLPEARVAQAIRDQVRALDPSLPVAGLDTMENVVRGSIARPRFLALLLSIFAGAALFLAAVGVYGVLSYSVAQRAQELGIRMALGADRRRILRLVLSQGMLLALGGVALGVVASLALSRLLESLLFGIAPTDPVTYGAVTALLAGVALAACALPAARAARVDPLTVLRSE